MPVSKGEYRVGISFNPSADSTVTAIKAASAALIDLIENMPKPEGASEARKGEIARLKALAQTHVEDAAMWAVKAATKQENE